MRTLTAMLAAAWLAGLTFPRSEQAERQGASQVPVTNQGRGGAPVQGAEEDLPLLTRFDRNGDKVLDYVERSEARAYLAANPALRRTTRTPSVTRSGTPG